jgi:hypothetical protein
MSISISISMSRSRSRSRSRSAIDGRAEQGVPAFSPLSGAGKIVERARSALRFLKEHLLFSAEPGDAALGGFRGRL